MTRPLPTSESAWKARPSVARFQEAYAQHYRAIERFVRRFSGRTDEAGDITQEAFTRLWRELDEGREVIDVRPWLYRVASHLVINRGRAAARAQVAQAHVEDAVQSWHRQSPSVEHALAEHQIVHAALGRLPEPMARALLLFHAGLTGREVADIIGVAPSYVHSLIIRGHERFRREYDALRRSP